MFSVEFLATRLDALAASEGPPPSMCVAVSGGADSVALLHALTQIPGQPPVRVVHVDHGLHKDSALWAATVAELAASLRVDCRVVKVDVAATGQGPEAAARDARYGVFAEQLGEGEWLLLAQHRDDQAETLLLNLLRGSGALGLAGMPAARHFGRGRLVRPLLGVSREELATYVNAHDLPVIADPSNADPRYDRNYVRQRVLPVLQSRWPSASRGLARSAALAGETQSLLDALGQEDLVKLGNDPARLSVQALLALAPPRRRNLLRHACRQLGLAPPPRTRLAAVDGEVLLASPSAQPVLRWADAALRRFRGDVYLGRAESGPEGFAGNLTPQRAVSLGSGFGSMALLPVTGTGIRASVAKAGLELRGREGGEALRCGPEGHRRRLKTLLQESAVLPWMRDCIPLLWSDDRLVAVADLWVDRDFMETGGYRVQWDDKPTLTATGPARN